MRSVAACALAVLLGLGSGCKDEASNAPPPPSTGGGATGAIGFDGGTRPPSDAGGGEDDEDGGGGEPGADSGVLPSECRNVTRVQVPVDEVPADTEASTSAPADFGVTRLVGTWEGGCEAPVFRIELSDGRCPDGRGHALTFLINDEALRDGSLRPGQNLLDPPNDLGVAIRYVRPGRLSPAGEWGTCGEEVSGVIDLFGDEPSTVARSRLDATFSLELPTCDADSDALPQTVSGTFSVTLRRGLAEYCPDL